MTSDVTRARRQALGRPGACPPKPGPFRLISCSILDPKPAGDTFLMTLKHDCDNSVRDRFVCAFRDNFEQKVDVDH